MNTNLNHLTLEQLQRLETKVLYTFHDKKFRPFIHKLYPQFDQTVAKLKGRKKGAYISLVFDKATSAYKKEHTNEWDDYYKRHLEIHMTIQFKLSEVLSP